MEKKVKVLLIRFSSFGDITQSLSIPTRLKELAPSTEVHWVTRLEFSDLVETHPFVDKLWTLDKKLGLIGLFKIISQLQKEKFDYIYDAHNNLRSRIITWMLCPPWNLSRWFSPPQLTRKSQKRWKRFLLFKFHKNLFQQPFSGQRDLLEPLQKWNLSIDLPSAPQLLLKKSAEVKILAIIKSKQLQNFVTVAASSAHILKRWPEENFRKLLQLNPKVTFVFLGGKEDNFIQSIIQDLPNAYNFAGQLSFQESASFIFYSQGLVCNDTGLLHIAEQLGKKAIALMGPAPFGFPSRHTTLILEKKLSCRPCSKHGQGPCVNLNYQECLRAFTPEQVSLHMQRWIFEGPHDLV